MTNSPMIYRPSSLGLDVMDRPHISINTILLVFSNPDFELKLGESSVS